MGPVTALLVLLLIGVLLATLQARKPAPASSAAPKRSKGPSAISPYWLLGALLLGAVLLRFGVNWLVVAGGMLLAALRSLAPLLRFLPLLSSLHRNQRAGGTGWAPPGGSGPGDSSGSGGGARPRRMTRQEALQVFGLDENATREDVQREYRRLMRKVHPDLGGSSYLAAKINEAKDVLS
jgi:DnaJ homolog subfamily C member 19